MPMHDWSKAEAAWYHAFRREWLVGICRVLNGGLLPQELRATLDDDTGGLGVRHVNGQRDLGRIEIASPAIKSDAAALEAFVQRACERLAQRIHLLLVDPFPPGPHDPSGIHGLIWNKLYGERFDLLIVRPLIFVSYECDVTARNFLQAIAVGDALPNMPLFLAPHVCFEIPLEATYEAAFSRLKLQGV